MIIKAVTLGCKVNQCESASIVTALCKRGYNASEGLAPADVYILNTCSVTAEADRKSRQYVGKMRKQNPGCKIIVIGCSSQNDAKRFVMPNVVAIGGTHNKTQFILDCIHKLHNYNDYSIISDIILYDKYDTNSSKMGQYCAEEYPISGKTRSFIKIQDGCNRFCSYCIIPYLRGRSVSKPISDILRECESVTSKEIVLTGIDMSYYGRDIGVTPAQLLRALGNVAARKRLGSLECEMIDDELLTAMRDGNYCPHFHLSLQSGDDAVLKAMNRRYDTKYYFDKVCLVRKYFPLAAITTDIIVGFPTESEQMFENGCDFIEKCGFSDIHVFPYSKRAGTNAAKKYGMLDRETVSGRELRLLEIKKAARAAFIEKNIGTTAPVYTEEPCGEYNVGYTPNYIKVYSKSPCGVITDLKLTKPYCDGVLGTDI